MENLGKDHRSSDSSLPSSAANKASTVPDVVTTYHLRDRELLRRKRAEALEKDSAQWILRISKSQYQRRGRGARRGRGRQLDLKATLVPKPTREPQSEQKKEAEQVNSEPEHSVPALPEPAYQEQLPVITTQDLGSEMQPVAMEEEPAASSLDLEGDEEAVKPTAEEILEFINTALENDHQNNEFNPHVLY